jgi:hypothetical protein
VIDAGGRAQLRQVRLGPQRGERVEVLAGLREGERVAVTDDAGASGAARPLGGADPAQKGRLRDRGGGALSPR